jgi:hypothetical protein
MCRAVTAQKGGGADAPAPLVERAVRAVTGREVEAVFAMPLASTRPQTAGRGASWWVCAAVKPTRARAVLLKGLEEGEAVRVAHALAARLELV